MSRPELTAPPELYYDDTEASKYTQNSRVIEVQTQMAQRAVELLAVPECESAFILDVGCGSGLSGEVLSEAGFEWVGMDISESMIQIGAQREVGGDLAVADMGQGVPFRPGTFDAAISISAVQWLCFSDRKDHEPRKRLTRFFTTLYQSLKRGARAVLQVYPEAPQQMELITQSALKAGFGGGVVVDFPNSSKAKKIFLVLFAGVVGMLPQAKTDEQGSDQVLTTGREYSRDRRKGRHIKAAFKGSREWINQKKEQRKLKGLKTARNSAYTGRKRKVRF
eukprot:Clim_evm55s147 gene=Clim_evmTU55s147